MPSSHETRKVPYAGQQASTTPAGKKNPPSSINGRIMYLPLPLPADSKTVLHVPREHFRRISGAAPRDSNDALLVVDHYGRLDDSLEEVDKPLHMFLGKKNNSVG